MLGFKTKIESQTKTKNKAKMKVKIKELKYVPGGHVDGVGGRQLELDGIDVEADGDGVEEGLLRLLPELEHRRQDIVPAKGLLLLLW